jgi:glutamate racemase
MEKQKSIGIFDSGVGGLSIGRAIKNILPEEDIVYFADIEFSPYGNKSQSIINQRSEDIVNFLINQQHCKLIVVACNTATVNSIRNLRAKVSVPIVGVEPAIKPAALLSKTGVIGVLATEQTIESETFKQLKSKYSQTVQIETKACPQFVSLVENLNHHNDQAVEVAEEYIRPLLLQGSDQIVLGCTHFSFLKLAINKVVGEEVNVIDTAMPVALQVKRIMKSLNLEKEKGVNPSTRFWASAQTDKVTESLSQLWEQDIKVSEIKLQTPVIK